MVGQFDEIPVGEAVDKIQVTRIFAVESAQQVARIKIVDY